VEIMVLLRSRAPEKLPSPEDLGRQPPSKRRYLSRRELTAAYGAHPKDVAAVVSFAHDHGLEVVGRNGPHRTVELAGSATQMEEAFDVKLSRYSSPRGEYRGRSGTVKLPGHLSDVIQSVHGLDDRRQFKSQLRAHSATGSGNHHPHRQHRSFTPTEIAKLYRFPAGLDGAGQRIAIIELGDGGYRPHELRAYFHKLGLPMPKITAIPVDGGTNSPGGSWDGEVLLDIEVIGSIVPAAELLVYFAPPTDKGFLAALSAAVHDPREPSVISISWGDRENEFTEHSRQAFDDILRAAAARGITVCVATGDHGYADRDGMGDRVLKGVGAHVDFPASHPYVLACGGTTMFVGDDGSLDEEVWGDRWSGTGGGVSAYYPRPAWQDGLRVPRTSYRFKGRGIPDVAGVADPETGYKVRLRRHDVQGGTSAVAPLWAGLIARFNQRLGTRVGYINPLLYEIAPTGFNSVTKGTNGRYRARLGWDACTGHGTPDGTALLKALRRAR
jgi:kumamolisin